MDSQESGNVKRGFSERTIFFISNCGRKILIRIRIIKLFCFKDLK